MPVPSQPEGVAAAAPLSAAAGAQLRDKVGQLFAQQQFIDQVREAHFAGQLDTAAEVPAAEPVAFADAARIAGLLPRVPSLADVEASQLASLDELNEFAEARVAATERAIRRVGLNPRLVMAKVEGREAQGGPLLAALTDSQRADPRFARLGDSVARMSALERGLDTIPTHLPASLEYVSSSFGYRSDPFTGEAAMHAGLDFRGPTGAPIQAAADGVVTFAGVKGGYGNCIEITHGNGLMTRYAHMSAFKARPGQKVAAGDTIGAIGSTGRSTGPHLHFEVRVNGAAVNPRPFLEART